MKVYLGFMKRDAHGLKALECCAAAAKLSPPESGDRLDFIWPDFGIEVESVEKAEELYQYATDGVNNFGRWRINLAKQEIERVPENIPGLQIIRSNYLNQQQSRALAGLQPDPKLARMIGYLQQDISRIARLITYLRGGN